MEDISVAFAAAAMLIAWMDIFTPELIDTTVLQWLPQKHPIISSNGCCNSLCFYIWLKKMVVDYCAWMFVIPAIYFCIKKCIAKGECEGKTRKKKTHFWFHCDNIQTLPPLSDLPFIFFSRFVCLSSTTTPLLASLYRVPFREPWPQLGAMITHGRLINGSRVEKEITDGQAGENAVVCADYHRGQWRPYRLIPLKLDLSHEGAVTTEWLLTTKHNWSSNSVNST